MKNIFQKRRGGIPLTKGDIIFDCVNYAFMLLVTMVFVFPLLFVISTSLMSQTTYLKYGYSFFPREIDFTAYQMVLDDSFGFASAFRDTIIVTVVGTTLYVDREYRWDSREEHRQKTDEEYADDMEAFMGKDQCAILADPSAASFIAALRRRGLYVIPADNDVLNGIRKTSVLFQRKKLRVNSLCAGFLGEVGTYLWDEKAAQHGEDKPLKERDHSMDALRYFVNSLPDWRFE